MSDEQEQIFNKWQKEQVYLETQKQVLPELFVKSESLGVKDQLSRVGIILPTPELAPGFVKYYPFDFIVEERLADGRIITVDDAAQVADTIESSGSFFHADLVKVGISTIDAIKELSKKLGIKETQIGYGGVKDATAVTAQRISIAGVTLAELQSVPETNYFLKNISPAKDAISMSNISGNRFTIFIRTPNPIDETQLGQRLSELSENGFWNFYWLQRFGNRLLSHWWGLCLMQGKEEKAIRSYLCDPGPNELPFFAQLRAQANKEFENWEAMIKLYEPLGFNMRYELLLLNYLKEFRHDYTGALRTISEQVKMWIYAYGSFVFNKALSLASSGTDPVPKNLPLLLSNNQKDHEVYRQFLQSDKLSLDFAQNLRRFDFIRFTPRTVETKLFAKILSHKVLPQGIVISFDLPKGAYATTFLSHIFTLDSSVAPLVQTAKYDLKEILDTGNITPTLKKLEKFMVIREVPPEE